MSDALDAAADGPVIYPAEGSIRHGDIRYVLIRADGLMGAFTPGQAPQLQALADSVWRHGRQSLARYFADNGGDIAATIASIESRAARMGWGRWSITRHERRLTLTIHNSPFAIESAAQPTCAPAAGMFRAVAELALGGEVKLVESQCIACGAPACLFEAVLDAG